MGGTDASEPPEVAQGGLFLLCVRQKDAVREPQGGQRRVYCDVGSCSGLELSWETCCEELWGLPGDTRTEKFIWHGAEWAGLMSNLSFFAWIVAKEYEFQSFLFEFQPYHWADL